MIDQDEAIQIHQILIERFGGSTGIRDIKTLESAIARPTATFDGKELYPTSIDKAAAIIESLVTNHPFIDGNKRIGYVLMRLYLMEEGFDIEANENDKYQFVIKISEGSMDIDSIKSWIENRIKLLP